MLSLPLGWSGGHWSAALTDRVERISPSLLIAEIVRAFAHQWPLEQSDQRLVVEPSAGFDESHQMRPKVHSLSDMLLEVIQLLVSDKAFALRFVSVMNALHL